MKKLIIYIGICVALFLCAKSARAAEQIEIEDIRDDLSVVSVEVGDTFELERDELVQKIHESVYSGVLSLFEQETVAQVFGAVVAQASMIPVAVFVGLRRLEVVEKTKDFIVEYTPQVVKDNIEPFVMTGLTLLAAAFFGPIAALTSLIVYGVYRGLPPSIPFKYGLGIGLFVLFLVWSGIASWAFNKLWDVATKKQQDLKRKQFEYRVREEQRVNLIQDVKNGFYHFIDSFKSKPQKEAKDREEDESQGWLRMLLKGVGLTIIVFAIYMVGLCHENPFGKPFKKRDKNNVTLRRKSVYGDQEMTNFVPNKDAKNRRQTAEDLRDIANQLKEEHQFEAETIKIREEAQVVKNEAVQLQIENHLADLELDGVQVKEKDKTAMLEPFEDDERLQSRLDSLRNKDRGSALDIVNGTASEYQRESYERLKKDVKKSSFFTNEDEASDEEKHKNALLQQAIKASLEDARDDDDTHDID